MSTVLNIAAYKFTALENLESLRADLKAVCEELALLGTILLAPEGINLFLAGAPGDIARILERIRDIPGFEDLPVKESLSAHQPFRKLFVKIKREIIAFGRPEVAPAAYTSRRIAPAELKKWLDEGREVTLLDTRNDYETEIGSFQNALTPPLDDFRQFPAAVANLAHDLRDRPVVTFCTGGIRCEKAAPWLEHAGFKNVFQLDGGILKYFQDCGGAHFRGDCFVFDERRAVTPELRPISDV
jgi:UPF0176 protein